LDKGCRNAHPLLRFSKKNFYSVKIPLTYLELQSQMTPYFSKNKKIFFRLRVIYFACPEKAPSLIPTENSQMHTLNRKKFLPLHLFGIERSKRTLFFRKKAKKMPANIGGHKKSPQVLCLWGRRYVVIYCRLVKIILTVFAGIVFLTNRKWLPNETASASLFTLLFPVLRKNLYSYSI